MDSFALKVHEKTVSAVSLSIVEGRIVDPDDPAEACNNPDVPQKQNIFYQYSTPLSILRKQASRAHSCNVTSETDFCTATLTHRQQVVSNLWTTMSKRKTVLHNPQDEVKTALEGCFLTCGTCMEGKWFLILKTSKLCGTLTRNNKRSQCNALAIIMKTFDLTRVGFNDATSYTVLQNYGQP